MSRCGICRALLLLCITAGALAGRVTAQPQAAPVVFAAEVDSIIQPVSAEYMIQTIAKADAAGAALLVFTLRTPGGMLDATRDIITRMIAAKTPVAIFVAPSGGRAASAGFILTIAADVAAMAPGTHIGAAHPVAGNGETVDATMAKKMEEDVAAYVRTLASARHRNVDLSMEAVRSSRAFTETEAAGATPPLVDVVAPTLDELLKALDGRTIARFDGRTETLHTAGARVVAIEMTWRQRVLGAIANPNIAYLLLSLGLLGLTIELWSPGGILPGVAGGVALLLAFFALQLLPVNYAGLLLILFGLLLFALEVKVASSGVLAGGGVISLFFGSLILFDSTSPELRVSLRVVIPVVVGFAIVGTLLVRLAVAAQRRPAVSGAGGMIGETGEALTAIEPGKVGQVSTHGEIWNAVADDVVRRGERVRVTAVNGLTITVRKD
jgi:membrane-bound serine protease (ClpP class)